MANGYTQAEIDMLNKAMAMKDGWHSLRDIAEELGVDRMVLLDALEVWDKAGRPQNPHPAPEQEKR